MNKVAVVTDSSAHIPSELTDGLPIFTIPLHVIWDDTSMLDDIEIKPEQFYQRLQNSPTTPRTSQTTPQEFLQFYQDLLEKGYDILSIHISSRVTSVLESAAIARRRLKSTRIEIVDSMSGAMAMGFQVISVARAAAAGTALRDCRLLAERARSFTHTYFIPGTLEFLRRGGRIGGAAAFLGSVLRINPILETRNGVIAAVERVRTMGRALDRVVDLVNQRVGSAIPVRLAAMHSNLPEVAQDLLSRLQTKLSPAQVCEAVVTGISPALGTHIGPGAVGIAYMAGM